MEETNRGNIGLVILKVVVFLLIVAAVLVVALYSFFDINPVELVSEGFTGIYNRITTINPDAIDELKQTVRHLMPIEASEKVATTNVSENLLIAATSYVKILDADGIEKGYIPVSLKKPYAVSSGNDALVVDLEGRYFALINNGRISWEKNLDENIVNAYISEHWVLLITESKQSGYKRTIRAYSKEGQDVSLRNVANYYPYNVLSYPQYNSGSFIVSSIEILGLESNGMLELLDSTMNQKASVKGINELFGGAYSLNNDSIFVWAERSVMAINKSYQTIWDIKYEGYTVSTANVIDGKYPVIALLNSELLAREKRYETIVKIYNNDGTEKAELLIDGKVTGISTNKKTAAIIAESEVIFIDEDGTIKDGYTARSKVQRIHLGKENLAYIVTNDSIERINIKIREKFLGIF